MNALLDTHTLLWWVGDPQWVSDRARTILADPATGLFWSAASTMEMAIKVGRGKLSLPLPLPEFLERHLERQRVARLAIEDRHALEVLALPAHHRDPFDRLLVAQARVERLPLLSADPLLRLYDVEVIW